MTKFLAFHQLEEILRDKDDSFEYKHALLLKLKYEVDHKLPLDTLNKALDNDV